MENHIYKSLLGFGLSEKEARLYLCLLHGDVMTVNEISKSSGVNRSSAYVVLEILKKKGLVGVSDDKKIRRYVAASPEILFYAAKKAAIEQENIKTEIEAILPELKAMHKYGKEKLLVKVFEGPNGLLNALEDSLDCREKMIRFLSSLDRTSKLLPAGYFLSYSKRRKQKGIKTRGIHPANELTIQLRKSNQTKFDHPVLIPIDRYKASADVAIYDDKVGYISAEKNGFAVIIESKEMAEAMKNIFDLAFEEAKKDEFK